MVIHHAEAAQHVLERFGSDRQHRRKADGAVHAVPPADPVPETEHVVGVDAERGHAVGVGRHGDEVFGDGGFVVAEAVQQPRPGGRRVGHGFLGRERLAGDDEQRFLRCEVARRLDEVSPVDVGHEPKRHVAVAVVPQGLVGHHRTQIAAADADVDHVADPPPGVTGPLTGANPITKRPHAVDDFVNRRNDVLAIEHDRRISTGPQCRVQHRAVLGGIDAIAAEHCVDTSGQTRRLGQRKQVLQRVVVDPVLAVIQPDAARLGGVTLGTTRVVGEQVPQVDVADRRVMFKQRSVGRQVGGFHASM